MQEVKISFSTAVLAKKKGFELPCRDWYNFSGLLIKDSQTYEYPSNDKRFPSYSAPTQALLQKWLRDEHKIHAEVLFIPINGCYAAYLDTNVIYVRFKSYEEALEVGLEYGLKKL
jgi:hypothetical protein